MAHLRMSTPETPAELLRSWRHRTRLNQKAHYAMVHRATTRAFWFGVATTVFSGLAGLLILITEKTDAPVWV